MSHVPHQSCPFRASVFIDSTDNTNVLPHSSTLFIPPPHLRQLALAKLRLLFERVDLSCASPYHSFSSMLRVHPDAAFNATIDGGVNDAVSENTCENLTSCSAALDDRTFPNLLNIGNYDILFTPEPVTCNDRSVAHRASA